MMIFDFFTLMLFFSGCLVFIMNYYHFLVMLLSLEILVLSLFVSMFMYLGGFSYEYFFSMFYLSMSVCEGALGLSLLVSIIRTHGSDGLYMFDNLW